jgi:integrase
MVAHLRVIEPRNENRSVPTRPANAELRSREYLTAGEVEKLMKAARNGGRYGHRDATLILVAYRHGLRATEICDLEWSQVEWGRNAALHVRRLKNGKPATHPLRGDEIRALRELQRQFPESAFVFATERGGPFTADAANRLIKRIGERAGFPFPGTRPHATARLRLCAGECGPRYARYTGLAWSQVNSAHRQIHRAFADAVQGFLAEVI